MRCRQSFRSRTLSGDATGDVCGVWQAAVTPRSVPGVGGRAQLHCRLGSSGGVLRIASLTAVLCLGCACGAYAAPLTLRDTGLVGSARSDAVSYIALTADGHSVTVLDTSTGARRVVPAPGPGCGFTDIDRGTLLWSCENPVPPLARGVTFDLATGRVGTLADAPAPPGSGAGPGFYAAIGDHWAAAMFHASDGRPLSLIEYVERTTGQQRLLDPTALSRTSVVDVDSPSLTRKLCDGQRRPYVANLDGTGRELGELATDGRWAAATTYPDVHARQSTPASVELQRCGAKPRTLKVCRAPWTCTQPVINDRIVAWVEARRRHGRLVVRSLRTGRTRAVTVRNSDSDPMEPLLAGSRLFLVSGGHIRRVAL
jgi:hypothetical protein